MNKNKGVVHTIQNFTISKNESLQNQFHLICKFIKKTINGKVMQFNQSTILGLFDSSQKCYEIPVYQRAYSWEERHWKVLLNDLIEHVKGKNDYFFGNLLLEEIIKDKKYEIIDGQQRLTTLTIFMRSILNVLKNKQGDIPSNEFNYQKKKSIYLKNDGNIKLRPVEYDRACFDTLIIDNKDEFSISTPSQERIKQAKEYFQKELSSRDTEDVLNILKKVEATNLTTIKLKGKKDSVLMFELENNRGKELTNMEKLKSYFMYQMYVYSLPEETDSNIEYISDIFKSIYSLVNDIKLNEDSILLYHNNAYINGFVYRTLDDVKDKFKKTNDEKIEWIKIYINELLSTFSNIKKFEKSDDSFALRLIELKMPAFIYPFIIKGYKFFGDDSSKLSTLFHILEIVTFKDRLISTRAKMVDRLNDILLSFKSDLSLLCRKLKNKFNDSEYWDNTKIHLCLNDMSKNNITNYILWRYEDSLQGAGYNIKVMEIENEEIEHISPKTPTNGEPIETGYEVNENNQYSEDFILDDLHSIGNLMLISKKHNASIGNKPFAEKLSTYKENPLLKQQAEIKEFADDENAKPVWKRSSISKRRRKIRRFVLENWDFDSVKISS